MAAGPRQGPSTSPIKGSPVTNPLLRAIYAVRGPS